MDYTNQKLKQYIFMGTLYSTDDWADMLVSVINALYELDEDIMESIANKNISKHISHSARIKSGKWIKIGNNVFLNTNSDTMAKVKTLRDVFDEYDLDLTELHFILYGEKSEKDLFDM